MSTQRYYFENGEIFQETTNRVKLSLQDRAITRMRESASVVTKDLIPDTAFATNAHGSWLVSEMEIFNFNTFWTAYEGEVFGKADQWPALRAVWRQQSGSIKKEVLWTPPSYMKLWFLSNYDNRSALQSCYLLASMDGDIWRPPLPNVYSNGSICMGSHFQLPEGELSMSEKHAYALNDFMYTDFNTDLDDGQSKYIMINDNGLIHPSMDAYKSILPMVSSSKLQFMKEIA